MSRSHGSDMGFDGGVGIGGGIAALAVLAIWLFIRMTAYIIQTFVKYHNVSKALWYSLYAFILLSLLGGGLCILFQSQSFASLGSIGYLILFLTCVVVKRHHAETFMVGENSSLTESILKRSWWADDSTPQAA
ncbi:MAG: hypothetical protein ACJ788_25975 [Ktedonobacteraceae bacterium]